MNWLKELAPLIGTALGGPLGGIAAGFVADKLGIKEKTIEAVTDVLNSGKMSADQIAALKLADIEFRKYCMAHEIDIERINAADRDSARQMQIATKSWVPSALSMLVTAGYFGILVGMMSGLLEVNDSQAMLIMLGSLSTAWGMVMAFWFGTTYGSQQTRDLLANSAPAK